MDREGAVIRNSRTIGSGQARITAQRVATVALAIFTIGTDVKERLRTEVTQWAVGLYNLNKKCQEVC